MNNFKSDFPLLKQTIQNSHLIYLDSAATTPKPQSVIDAISNHYIKNNGNPGRGNHTLSFNASKMIENARRKVLDFFGGTTRKYSVAFTKNATESINTIAHSILFTYKNDADKPLIIITESEHHSNMLPWVRLNKDFGFPLRVVDVLPNGEINYNLLNQLLSENKNGLLAITHGSNVTGIQTKMVEALELAKKNNFDILLDATQTVPHIAISLKNLPVTYLVCSAHKMFGPEGVGILIIDKDSCLDLEPFMLGGGMIREATTYNYYPLENVSKWEAGTLHSSGIAGAVKAIEYIQEIRNKGAIAYEEYLMDYFKESYKEKAKNKINLITDLKNINLPIFSFSSQVHPHDIADFLDESGIAVRAGHHCAQPLHKKLHLDATVRVSLSFYNTKDDIDNFFELLLAAIETYK